MIRDKWQISKDHKDASVSILQSNLAALRAKADINQEEISNIIGVSRQTYCAIESGKREMSWNTFLSFIFFFHELDSTREMINELRIYPIELIMKFNDKR